jgi:hypothetical protein
MTQQPIPIATSASSSRGRLKVELVAVDPTAVGSLSRLLESFLGGVSECSGGTNDFASVLDLARAKLSQLWVAVRLGVPVGAYATEIIRYPRAVVLRVWIGGGDAEAMISTLGDLESYARDEGCSQILVEGPASIRRLYAEHFELARVVLRRGVGDGERRIE